MVVFATSLAVWHYFPCLIVAGPALPMQLYHNLVLAGYLFHSLEQMRSPSRNEGKTTY